MPSSLTLLLCGFILFKEYKGSTERKRINIRQTLNPANVALKEKLRTCTSLFGSFKRHCQAKGTKFWGWILNCKQMIIEGFTAGKTNHQITDYPMYTVILLAVSLNSALN